MFKRFPPVMVVVLVVGVAAAIALAQRGPSALTAEIRLSTDMAEAARRLLSVLTPAQRARAVFPIAADERLRWHYVPQPRLGLAFRVHAVLTAGHTQGCTTWTTTAHDSGRSYSVVFLCVPQAAAGVKLLGSKQQPNLPDDLARSLRVLKALNPDIYLDGHPEDIFAGKIARLRAGEVPSPLVDRAGYRKYLADCEADLQRRLQQERSGH